MRSILNFNGQPVLQTTGVSIFIGVYWLYTDPSTKRKQKEEFPPFVYVLWAGQCIIDIN